DDADTLRLVASALEGVAQVHSTPSVAEAKASIPRYEFDAIIIDVGMADGSGLELVPLIRKRDRRIPIILFTALDREHGADSDIDAHLTKSKSDLGELVSTVEELLTEAEGAR
ncbi:MAG TPA: response regulator, partial [Sphingomicrobium sp.]